MNSLKKNSLCYLLSLIFTFQSINSSGQTQEFKRCGANNFMKMQENDDLEMKKKRTILNELLDEQLTQNKLQKYKKDNSVFVRIPVVFHILYNDPVANISNEQIKSQLDVLNEDYGRRNADANDNWDQAADTQIQFEFANITPSGTYFRGINRTQTSRTEFAPNSTDMFFNSSGGRNIWDDYLNIYVCNLDIFEYSVLGIAPFPGGSRSTDGVVIDYRALGRGANFALLQNYNKGRTCTHEVGHWLNLNHTWGPDVDENGVGSCNLDDGITDTPNSNTSYQACQEGSTCGSEDMSENFMDYHDDECMNLFTAGQGTKMRSSINLFRIDLKNHTKSDRCLPSINILIPFQNEVKQITSYDEISAKNNITSNSDVRYFAKNRITLNSGFRIDGTSSFRADIVGSCN